MKLQFLSRHARAVMLAMAVIIATPPASHDAVAAGGGGGGAGGGGGGHCSNYAGKELYNCLASKLDKTSVYTAYRSPDAQAALQKAASQLRAATSKSQALSAISQCRSVVAGIMQRVRSAGTDSSDLAKVTGVLAYAARLIQEKG